MVQYVQCACRVPPFACMVSKCVEKTGLHTSIQSYDSPPCHTQQRGHLPLVALWITVALPFCIEKFTKNSLGPDVLIFFKGLRQGQPVPVRPGNHFQIHRIHRLQGFKRSKIHSAFVTLNRLDSQHNSPHSGITLLHHQAVSNHRTPQRVRCGLLIQFNMMCEFKEQMSV